MTDFIDSLHEDLAALTRRFADAIDAILLDIRGPPGAPWVPPTGPKIDARLSQPEDRLFGAPGEQR